MVLLPSTAAPPASLEGVVVSEETGAPLAGATVRLESIGLGVLATLLNDGLTPPAPAVTTNEKGLFSFPKVEKGSYVVEARRDGYVAQTVGVGDPLKLDAGQHIGNISVRLKRAARINGLIRDASGRPAAGVPVQLFQADALETPVAQTKSAADGSYRLDGFLPGQYTVAAGSLPPLAAQATMPAGSFAARVAAPTTAAVTLNASLDAGAGYALRGRVAIRDSSVLPDAVTWNVSAIAPSEGRQPVPINASRFTYNPLNGTFVLQGFRPGIYRIGAEVSGQGCGGVVVLVSDTDVGGLALTLGGCK